MNSTYTLDYLTGEKTYAWTMSAAGDTYTGIIRIYTDHNEEVYDTTIVWDSVPDEETQERIEEELNQEILTIWKTV
jgi:hypothetical protein